MTGPRLIGEVLAESLPKWGKRAIRLHLNCASTATGEIARESFDQANGMRLSMGLTWQQVYGEANDNGNSLDRGAA